MISAEQCAVTLGRQRGDRIRMSSVRGFRLQKNPHKAVQGIVSALEYLLKNTPMWAGAVGSAAEGLWIRRRVSS